MVDGNRARDRRFQWARQRLNAACSLRMPSGPRARAAPHTERCSRRRGCSSIGWVIGWLSVGGKACGAASIQSWGTNRGGFASVRVGRRLQSGATTLVVTRFVSFRLEHDPGCDIRLGVPGPSHQDESELAVRNGAPRSALPAADRMVQSRACSLSLGRFGSQGLFAEYLRFYAALNTWQPDREAFLPGAAGIMRSRHEGGDKSRPVIVSMVLRNRSTCSAPSLTHTW